MTGPVLRLDDNGASEKAGCAANGNETLLPVEISTRGTLTLPGIATAWVEARLVVWPHGPAALASAGDEPIRVRLTPFRVR